jgi:hypothetical protein
MSSGCCSVPDTGRCADENSGLGLALGAALTLGDELGSSLGTFSPPPLATDSGRSWKAAGRRWASLTEHHWGAARCRAGPLAGRPAGRSTGREALEPYWAQCWGRHWGAALAGARARTGRLGSGWRRTGRGTGYHWRAARGDAGNTAREPLLGPELEQRWVALGPVLGRDWTLITGDAWAQHWEKHWAHHWATH